MTLSDFVPGLEQLNLALAESSSESDSDYFARQRAQDVAVIWWDSVADDYHFMEMYVEFVLNGADEIQDYKVTLSNLEQSIRERKDRDTEIWADRLLGILKAYVSKVKSLTLQRVRSGGAKPEGVEHADFSAHMELRAVSLLIARIENVDYSLQLRKAVRDSRQDAADAHTAAESARNAAGMASGSTLTARFNSLASRHFWAATSFRILTAAGVIFGLWFALEVSIGESVAGPVGSPGHAILRISLLAGVLGLATYFGRQAAYHRDVSTWARTIKEQLLTFDGYMEPVTDDELRHQMRAAFAARVFGPSPESKEDGSVTLSSPVLSELATAVAKAGAKP